VQLQKRSIVIALNNKEKTVLEVKKLLVEAYGMCFSRKKAVAIILKKITTFRKKTF